MLLLFGRMVDAPAPRRQYGLLVVSEESGTVLNARWFDTAEERECEMMNRATLTPGFRFRLEERDASE
jgi:hypothetical protein